MAGLVTFVAYGDTTCSSMFTHTLGTSVVVRRLSSITAGSAHRGPRHTAFRRWCSGAGVSSGCQSFVVAREKRVLLHLRSRVVGRSHQSSLELGPSMEEKRHFITGRSLSHCLFWFVWEGRCSVLVGVSCTNMTVFLCSLTPDLHHRHQSLHRV